MKISMRRYPDSAGLWAFQFENRWGDWEVHVIVPKKKYWLLGRKLDWAFPIMYYGLGPLLLVTQLPPGVVDNTPR